MAGLRPLLRRVERVRDDEECQLADDRSALDVRHEVGRRDEHSVRQRATDECLGGAGGTARKIEDGLVHDDQLVLLERGLDIAHDAGVDAATHHDRLVARVALRRVHLAVRAGEKLLGGRAVVGEHRPADAAVDLHGRAVDAKRPPQRVAQPSDERSGTIVAPGAHREDDELVAAHAGDGVRLADDRLEAPGQ